MDRKYTRHLICALSLVAGLPFGLFFEVLPLFMRQANLSLTVIGLAGWAQLPWIAKPLWAPLVDRTGNLARWLTLVALALGLALAGLGLLAPAPKLLPLIACLLLLCAASASQDLVIDATFVAFTRTQRLTLRQTGSLSAWRMAAYKCAVLGGSGLALACASKLGWRWTFVACGLCASVSGAALARALPRLGLQSKPVPAARTGAHAWPGEPAPPAPPGWQAFGRELLQWLVAPHMPQVLAFVFFYKLTLCCLGPMSKPFWLDHGATSLQLGATTGALELGGALLGVAAASRALRHWPLTATLVSGSLLESATAVLYLCAELSGSLLLLAPALLLEGVAQGMTTTLLTTVLTRLCGARQAATQFAVLSALFGLTRATGGSLGGALAHYLGWPTFLALLPLLAVPALFFVKPLQARLNATP